MIVVSDTSPINYLILIDFACILPSLFQQVRIPQQVFQELSSPKAPKKVRDWIGNPLDWLTVETVAGGPETFNPPSYTGEQPDSSEGTTRPDATRSK